MTVEMMENPFASQLHVSSSNLFGLLHGTVPVVTQSILSWRRHNRVPHCWQILLSLGQSQNLRLVIRPQSSRGICPMFWLRVAICARLEDHAVSLWRIHTIDPDQLQQIRQNQTGPVISIILARQDQKSQSIPRPPHFFCATYKQRLNNWHCATANLDGTEQTHRNRYAMRTLPDFKSNVFYQE